MWYQMLFLTYLILDFWYANMTHWISKYECLFIVTFFWPEFCLPSSLQKPLHPWVIEAKLSLKNYYSMQFVRKQPSWQIKKKKHTHANAGTSWLGWWHDSIVVYYQLGVGWGSEMDSRQWKQNARGGSSSLVWLFC